MKGAAVIDMNKTFTLPSDFNSRKNKNDFYRFLLDQNNSYEGDYKMNNDVLIPRSIIKKCGDKPHNRMQYR